MTPEELEAANVELAELSPEAIIDWAVRMFGEGLVVASSFGDNAAILLHMALTRHPDLPVIFINTGEKTADEMHYVEDLAKRLDTFLHMHNPEPPMTDAERELLTEGGEARLRVLERCKIAPMREALESFTPRVQAVLHGAHAFQSGYRSTLRVVEPPGEHGRIRIFPALRMTQDEAVRYLFEHDLPIHPHGLPGGGRIECRILA